MSTSRVHRFVRLALSAAAVVLATGGIARADDATPMPITPAAAQLPAAEELMRDLLARLPAKPVLLSGDLITTGKSREKSKLAVTILLSYPQQATYTIQDVFGRPLERLTVTRGNGNVSMRYEKGDPLSTASTPALSARIQDTALSWSDLTLDFLWWKGGSVIGREEVRGQPCYVLDRHAARQQDDPYAGVRLWVDTRVSMLLQADGFNKLGDPVRRLSVKSFKKIKDEWMIKDLEIEDEPAGLKTLLRVRDAQPVEPPAKPE